MTELFPIMIPDLILCIIIGVWYYRTAAGIGLGPPRRVSWLVLGVLAYGFLRGFVLGVALFPVALFTSTDFVRRLAGGAIALYPATVSVNMALLGVLLAVYVRWRLLRSARRGGREPVRPGPQRAGRPAGQGGSLRLLGSAIREKLVALKGALRRRLASEGVSWLMVSLVALVFLTLGFDYTFRLNRDLRLVLMEASLVGVLWVLWRQFLRPLRVPMAQEDLALLVERRYGQLGDRLISAVEFSRADPAHLELASPAMIDRMAHQANEMARPLDFQKVVERSDMWRAVGAAACAAMLLGGFAVWKHDVIALWFQRNVTIWSTAEWPQQTVLRVEGGPDFVVVRGRDLGVTISVEAGKVAPEYVTVHADYPSVTGTTEDTVHLTDPSSRTYVKVFRAVAEPFEFYVTGGDDSRDKRRPHKVRVLDPPALRDVTFTVVCPAYMKQEKPRKYPGSLGTINVPDGSTVQIAARATKDLASARILLDGKPAGEMAVRSLAVAGSGGARQRGVRGHFQLEVKPVARGKARRVRTRELKLALTDTDGISDPVAGQYLIQVLPDQDPKVSARKQGVGSRVTPNATIPLLVHGTDDCGVTALKTQIQVLPEKKPPLTAAIPLAETGTTEVHTRHELELADRFEPKTVIQISVQAEDTFPSNWGGPNRSGSGVLDFRIVRPEELMRELVQRQKELRLEFVRTIALQASARAKVLLAIQTAGGDTVPLEAQQAMTASSGLQTSVASECAKAAMTLQVILDELTYNKLGTRQSRQRLDDDVVQPLRDLAGPIETTIEALRSMAKLTDAVAFRQQADLTAKAQLKILDELKAIRDRMQKLESRQELAYKLEMIIKLWNQVVKTTEKASEDEVGKTLGPGKKPSTRPATQPTDKKDKPETE